MTNNVDDGQEPEAGNNSNSNSDRPAERHGFGGRGGHFGPRGFRGGRGLGGHLGEVVLAERFARGEIDEAEYRERIAVLREVQAEGRDA